MRVNPSRGASGPTNGVASDETDCAPVAEPSGVQQRAEECSLGQTGRPRLGRPIARVRVGGPVRPDAVRVGQVLLDEPLFTRRQWPVGRPRVLGRHCTTLTRPGHDRKSSILLASAEADSGTARMMSPMSPVEVLAEQIHAVLRPGLTEVEMRDAADRLLNLAA